MIIRENDHFPHTTRYQKYAELYGEQCGRFRVIELNVKLPLAGLLEMTAILKVRLTSTFSNRAQNAPQDVPSGPPI